MKYSAFDDTPILPGRITFILLTPTNRPKPVTGPGGCADWNWYKSKSQTILELMTPLYGRSEARTPKTKNNMLDHIGPDQIETIIWDWNGTLLDDLEICIRSMNRMLRERKMPPIDKQLYKNIFTFPVREYYEKIPSFTYSIGYVLFSGWHDGPSSIYSG